MSRLSQWIFLAMSLAFGVCIIGLAGGMAYDLFLVIARHNALETVLGNSIPFYKCLGAIGILGFLLFLAFLLSSVSGSRKPADPKK